MPKAFPVPGPVGHNASYGVHASLASQTPDTEHIGNKQRDHMECNMMQRSFCVAGGGGLSCFKCVVSIYLSAKCGALQLHWSSYMIR